LFHFVFLLLRSMPLQVFWFWLFFFNFPGVLLAFCSCSMLKISLGSKSVISTHSNFSFDRHKHFPISVFPLLVRCGFICNWSHNFIPQLVMHGALNNYVENWLDSYWWRQVVSFWFMDVFCCWYGSVAAFRTKDVPGSDVLKSKGRFLFENVQVFGCQSSFVKFGFLGKLVFVPSIRFLYYPGTACLFSI
jgi:hypothetical protein